LLLFGTTLDPVPKAKSFGKKFQSFSGTLPNYFRNQFYKSTTAHKNSKLQQIIKNMPPFSKEETPIPARQPDNRTLPTRDKKPEVASSSHSIIDVAH
jgi:hypothetical protein